MVNRFAVLGLIGNPKPLSTLVCRIRFHDASDVLRGFGGFVNATELGICHVACYSVSVRRIFMVSVELR